MRDIFGLHDLAIVPKLEGFADLSCGSMYNPLLRFLVVFVSTIRW
jgi:hypothetical protein